MRKMETIQGIVKGYNTLQCDGRLINCWVNKVDDHGVRQPLDLFQHVDEVVEIEGMLESDLWEAKFVKKFNKAKEANSLNDLLRIRAVKENHDKIEAINEYRGTALGFKWTRKEKTKHPCIIIFVPEKKPSESLSPEELAHTIMEYNNKNNPNDELNGKWCFTDVVAGKQATDINADELPPLTRNNKKVVDELNSGKTKKKGLIGGIKLAYYENGIISENHKRFGTAGIAVEHKTSGDIGFLTNKHVAETPGREIYHPDFSTEFQIGSTSLVKEYEKDKKWYSGIIDEINTNVRCDCGFVKINRGKVIPGLYKIGEVGHLMRIDPGTMDIIGQPVISIGCGRGIQRGTIAAYSYEYWDGNETIYTDLLIIGKEKMSFTAPGDSGKLIVTDDDKHRPVGLLWGGEQGQLSSNKEQDVWGKAIDLGKILDILSLKILK